MYFSLCQKMHTLWRKPHLTKIGSAQYVILCWLIVGASKNLSDKVLSAGYLREFGKVTEVNSFNCQGHLMPSSNPTWYSQSWGHSFQSVTSWSHVCILEAKIRNCIIFREVLDCEIITLAPWTDCMIIYAHFQSIFKSRWLDTWIACSILSASIWSSLEEEL